MHRLKTRKKGKAPVEEEVPVVPSLPFLSKKKQQAPAPEKPQVDIDAALPSTDDFRTSLLMPNLAQRFSILKMEQAAAAAAALEAERKVNEKEGDQNEMLYQYPSQHFGSSLADIAETASINGSIACTVRSDEGRPSDDGSVMNRPRGGEGNILFGGRQKVYRVPNKGLRGTNSMDDLQPEDSMRGGKPLYEDYLPESITRPKAVDDEHLSLSSARNTGSHEAEQTEYNKNRFTSSSTNSMPNTNTTRFSTAATSISSQHGHTAAPTSVPQSPTASKPRRPLYEQALDQQLQEQKMTAMDRLERLASMRRAGATSPIPQGDSPIPGSLNTAVTPSSPTSRPPLTRTWSAKLAAGDISISPTVVETSESPETTETGISPQFSPVALSGFDFGITPKAERSASPEQSHRPTSPEIRSEPLHLRRSEESVRFNQQQLGRAPTPPLSDHPGFRNFSPPRRQDPSENNSEYASSRAVSRQQSLDQIAAIEQLEKELSSPIIGPGRFAPRIEIPGPDLDQNGVSQPSSPISITSEVSALSDMRSEPTPLPIQNPSLLTTTSRFDGIESDSPTLPTGGGLSAMVRQHLRSNSDASSIYADSMYTRKSRAEPLDQLGIRASEDSHRPESSIGNPWQYDDDFDPNNDEMKVPELMESPTSLYQPTIAPRESPPRRYTPPRRTSATPPPVPLKSPDRPSSRMASRPGSAMGGWTEFRTGRPESRGGFRPESRNVMSRPGSRIGGSESRGGNYPDSRMGSRPGSRMDRTSDEEVGDGRNRLHGHPGDDRAFGSVNTEEEELWQQQLASRRQLLQERIQEKVLSMHETEPTPGTAALPGKPTEGLRTKASNGFFKRQEGPRSRPSSRPSSRNRQHTFDPLEDEWSVRQRGLHQKQSMEHIHPAQRPMTGHSAQYPPIDQMHPAQRPQQVHPAQRAPSTQRLIGPPNQLHPAQRGPQEHMHPAQRPHPDPRHPSNRQQQDQMPPSQRPPQHQPRPMLDTGRNPPQLRADPSPGLPHPKHSPMYTPRMRQQSSNEQMNSGYNTPHGGLTPGGLTPGGISPGGLSPGWSETPADSPRSGFAGRSYPGTPLSSGPGSESDTNRSRHPPRDGYFPNDSAQRMRSPPRVPEESRMNGFGIHHSPPQDFDRQSQSSGGSYGRQRNNSDGSTNQGPPPGTGRSSPVEPATNTVDPVSLSPKQAAPAKQVDARVVAQTIKQVNAQYQPAKKRVVKKNQISQPKLMTKALSIPTIDIPNGGALGGHPFSTPMSAGGARRKTRADIFASLGRKDDRPPSSSTRSDEDDEKPRKGLTSRLRKSISDGGGLSQRGRVVDMDYHHEAMPKINKRVIGAPAPQALHQNVI